MSIEFDTDGRSARDQDLIERGRRAELLDAIRQVVGDEFQGFRNQLPEIVRPVVRDQVNESLARYYGDREPEQVLEVIRSAEKFHKRLNELADNFWSTAIAVVVRWSFWIFLVGYFLSHNDWIKPSALINTNPLESP